MNPDTPPSARPPLAPAVIGFVLAGITILGLGLWTARRPDRAEHPQLTLLQPLRDTVVNGPLTLIFRTGQPLSLRATGWGSGRHHVHVMANSTELMPAAADIRPLGAGRYAWTLSSLPDSARVRLVWALPDHRRLTAGASDLILVRTHR